MKLEFPDWRSIDCAKPDCPKCSGVGAYNNTPHGTAHWKPCELCCPHDQGYWQLGEHYADYGAWCCLAGCGHTVTEKPER